MKNNPQILGLALGGGAFRVTANFGVLKALEEEGLGPAFLCDISAGAIANAFYAFGMPPEEIRDVAKLNSNITNLRSTKISLPYSIVYSKYLTKFIR